MTPLDLRKHYSYFLKANQGKLHFAAHSHHFWPDVSREAQLEYWDDSAKFVDDKWEHVFTHIIPKTQNHIAKILHLKNPNQIAFAPNTHELVARLLSHFLGRNSLHILTSTSEFHSFRRQLLRLSEFPQVKISYVSTSSLLSERKLFLENLKSELKNGPDFFYLSQVFFDSGIALTDDELSEICSVAQEKTVIVIDGYHGFAAIPTNLSKLEGRIFYVSGGYKYAQAGEGVGFMVIPKGQWRPVHTGWFAELGELSSQKGEQVGYSNDGMSFMGATQDPSGFYRFNKVWDMFGELHLTIPTIHQHIVALQKEFLRLLPAEFLSQRELTPLFNSELSWHGHFLTFKAKDTPSAQSLENKLRASGIFIDRRGERLRFGMGLYHTYEEIHDLIERLKKLA